MSLVCLLINLFILEGRELGLMCVHECLPMFDFSAEITDINVRNMLF